MSRMIKDDRGRSVRCIDPFALQLMHNQSVLDRATLDALLDSLESGLARSVRYAWLTVIGAVVALAGLAAIVYLVSDAAGQQSILKTLGRTPAIWFGLIAGAAAPYFVARQKHGASIRAALLERQRCPHCGYDLSHLAADPDDGATVCPECACAWRLPDEP